MENENINTNATDTQMNSTNESKSESFANEALTANTNYGTISASDIENGTAELVLIPSFEGDDGGISVACVEGDDSSCNMASQTDRDNATLLTLDQWKCDSITDTVSERWYKFYVSDYATYTIYTTGSTNTTGRLYDYAGNLITINDDRAGSLNFRIVYPLSVDPYNSDSGWYYVKVTTPQTETGEFHIRVIKRVLVSQVTVSDANVTLDIGETYTLSASVYPDNADNKRISFSSYNTDVATIDPDTGVITAISPGIASICAFDWNNDGEPGRCEVWVRGKKPVILIHGRTSNSFDVWGATNKFRVDISDVEKADNNEAKQYLYAEDSNKNMYVDPENQMISPYVTTNLTVYPKRESDSSVFYNTYVIPGIFDGEFKNNVYYLEHTEGGNLAYYLISTDDNGISRGYIEDVNLFAFNYPNEDAVVYSAQKLEKYIENLIEYVRAKGNDKMKACFYRSREDYEHKNCNAFDIVAHSMGGLVARYYIENLNHSSMIDKLITICTPYWGSGYADESWLGGDSLHKLCDHDLDKNSKMYGGTNSLTLNTCFFYDHNGLSLTDELNYLKERSTKYYAIAGVDLPDLSINENDVPVEMNGDIDSYAEISEVLHNHNVAFPLKLNGDNLVGFLSQIGWNEVGVIKSTKIVPMEHIYVDVDTNFGNLELLDKLHNKIPHRTCVIEKVYSYLMED